MMEKEESTCRLRGNAESRKGRWDVVDGDERRQKLVATQRQRLSKIVGHVADAGNMPHAKLSLCHTVLQPMPPHVAGFGKLGLDGVVGEPDRHLIIAMDDGGGLRVPKVMLDLAFGDSNLGGGERAGVLGLLNRGTDDGDAVEVGGDGCVDEGGSETR
jgi:hypothetical protein